MTEEQNAMGSTIASPVKAEPAEKAEPTVKLVTPEAFITSSPLFIRVATDNFRAPSKIKFECSECKSETDWPRVYSPTLLGNTESTEGKVADYTMYSVAYKCFRCEKAILTVVYKQLRSKSGRLQFVRGLGFREILTSCSPIPSRQ